MSWTRRRLPCVLIAWIILLSGTPVGAHKGAGEGPPDAATWVRQALAFLQLKPPNFGEAAERLKGALKAGEPGGVDLALVREACVGFRIFCVSCSSKLPQGTAKAPSRSRRNDDAGGESPNGVVGVMMRRIGAERTL